MFWCRSQEYNRETKWCSCDVLEGMIFTSFQYNLEGVIESSLKLKFNIPSMGKLTSPVKRKTRSLFFSDDSCRRQRQKHSFNSEDTILDAFNIAEGLAVKIDLILSKISKTR